MGIHGITSSVIFQFRDVPSSVILFSLEEIGKLSKRDLWMIGLGIYIGEGAKLYESIRIINSDPSIVQIAIQWLMEICNVPLEHISIMHIYPDISEREAVEYWSCITGVPISQFGKTQADRRMNKFTKKRRKLRYGTAHINVRSKGKQELGVQLHRRIMGWIEEAYTQCAGIV